MNNVNDDENTSKEAGILDVAIVALTDSIKNIAPQDGFFSYEISCLHVGRSSKIDIESAKTFFQPSLGIATQGAKLVTIEKNSFQYDSQFMYITPLTVPVSLRTIKASMDEPFISIRLDLEPKRISELVLQVFPNGLPHTGQRQTSYAVKMDINIVNAMIRLVACLDNAMDVKHIAPLIVDEILIRLLRSPIGVYVAELGVANSDVEKVSKAIAYLHESFAQLVKVEELAKLVNMSSSSFHQHFKSVTAMSPLRYQKVLRLQEAKRLMIVNKLDAITACRLVGYVSDSQFSRDYTKYFGNSPKKHITSLIKRPQTLKYEI